MASLLSELLATGRLSAHAALAGVITLITTIGLFAALVLRSVRPKHLSSSAQDAERRDRVVALAQVILQAAEMRRTCSAQARALYAVLEDARAHGADGPVIAVCAVRTDPFAPLCFQVFYNTRTGPGAHDPRSAGRWLSVFGSGFDDPALLDLVLSCLSGPSGRDLDPWCAAARRIPAAYGMGGAPGIPAVAATLPPSTTRVCADPAVLSAHARLSLRRALAGGDAHPEPPRDPP